MKVSKLKIKTKNRSYNVIVGSNIIKNLSKIFNDNSINFKKCLLVIDNKVPNKFIKKIKYNLKRKKKITYIFNSNEINKNQKIIDKILNILLKNNFHRSD